MKTILHLCADIGSDSRYYDLSPEYNVIKIGEKIGVENIIGNEYGGIHGIIANPVCTEFSTAKGFHKKNDLEKAMFLYDHCMRVIKYCNPVFWCVENPYNGRLKDLIGKPDFVYQPWNFGSPWTKKTALWGKFNKPEFIFNKWEDVPKNKSLYVRPTRNKPSLAFLHKSAIDNIEEFNFAKPFIKLDSDFRSLCSQGFAKAFFDVNP